MGNLVAFACFLVYLSLVIFLIYIFAFFGWNLRILQVWWKWGWQWSSQMIVFWLTDQDIQVWVLQQFCWSHIVLQEKLSDSRLNMSTFAWQKSVTRNMGSYFLQDQYLYTYLRSDLNLRLSGNLNAVWFLHPFFHWLYGPSHLRSLYRDIK